MWHGWADRDHQPVTAVADVLAMLGGLAQADDRAGIGSVSGRVFAGVFWSLAYEAEVHRLGLPVRGVGFGAEPIGTSDEIQAALVRYLAEDN